MMFEQLLAGLRETTTMVLAHVELAPTGKCRGHASDRCVKNNADTKPKDFAQ